MAIESFEYHDEPNIIVEIAWEDNYAEPFPVWTDITEYVDGFNTSLGRTNEIGQIEAGVVTLTLDNKGGTFTPGNVNSPFYPNVRPRRQVRVRVDDGSPSEAFTPVLTNDVLNPNFIGDGYGCGFKFVGMTSANFLAVTPDKSDPRIPTFGAIYDPSWPIETGWVLGEGGAVITAHAGLTSTAVPFPCVPGDRISAHVKLARLLGEIPGSADYVRVKFIRENGTVISFVDGNAVGSIGWLSSHIENTVAPDQAVGYLVDIVFAATADFPFAAELAAYNHGQTDYDWPTGETEFICGDILRGNGLAPNWRGVPNLSPTDIYADREIQCLGRGYVERWPVSFSGTASEVTVPVTDWLSAFGTYPLARPLRFEYERRGVADLFTFGDGEDGQAFGSLTRPGVVATPMLAYKPTHQIYAASGNEPPKIEGGQESLVTQGLEGAASIRTTGQFATTISGVTYYVGTSLDVPIPTIRPATDSFSFAFIWEIFEDTIGGLAPGPIAIVLKNRRNVLFKGPEITLHQAGGGMNLTIRGRDRITHAKGLGAYGVNDPADLFGFSWDADAQVMRAGFGYSYDVEEQATFFLPDGTAPVWARDIMSQMVLNQCVVLGHADPTWTGGCADAGMQFLGRWDHALSSGDFYQLRRAMSGFDGQRTDQRLDYILDVIGWPNELRRLSPSETRARFAGWEDGTDAASWLTSTAADANGLFYVGSDGMSVYADRKDRTLAQNKWTLTPDDGTDIESGLTFEMSETDIVNEAVVNNAFGVNVTIRNEASIQEFGVKSQSYDVRLYDDTEAISFGTSAVSRYGDPIIRVDSVTLNPSASAYGNLWNIVTGVRIGDLLTIAGLPDEAPAESMQFFIERIQHDVVRDGKRLKWLTTLNLSPGSVAKGWVLGDPELSLLGDTTRILY